ncbi:hypothetical protein HDU99_006666, partial [Rhizoclosmatium hyalinum]
MVVSTHGLTKSATCSIYQRMEKHPDRSHGNQIFSDEFESALTAFLEARSMISQPMTHTDFISYVTKTRAEIYGPSEWSAASWYPGFMACHQNQVLVRNTKAISKSRKNPITYESIKLWNEAYPAYMKEKGYSSTTHFLQPLDAAPFANLKNKIWQLYDQKKSFTTEQLGTLSQELVPVVLQAHDCLTPELLRSAFQKTG